jgi:hypothetical protein
MLLTGQPVNIAVDDFVPVIGMDRPAFVGTSKSRMMWPLIMEKAWAKMFGTFKAVEGGVSHEAMRAFTQAPVEIVAHRDLAFPEDVSTPEMIWQQLMLATEKKYPMAANSIIENTTYHGLAKGHSYAVLEASISTLTNGSNVRTVLLYNPWGKTDYKGSVQNSFDDGRFVMLFTEYLEAFYNTQIAKVRNGYKVSPLVLSKGLSGRIHSELQFDRTDDAPFSIQVEWPSRRLMEASGCSGFNPGVHLSVSNSDGDVVVQAEYKSTDAVYAMSSVHVDMPGGIGTYNITVFAQFHGEPWLNEVVLNAYAPQQVNFKHTPTVSEPRGVLLSGFDNKDLNAWYTARYTQSVNGVETYWAALGTRFMFWCSKHRKWYLTYDTALDQVNSGACLGKAFAPVNRDILDPSLVKYWEERNGSSSHVGPKKGVTLLKANGFQYPAEIRLDGFLRQSLNSVYYLRPEFKVHGGNTYWSSDFKKVLFMCPQHRKWMIGSDLEGAQKCAGFAHSPEHMDIFHPEPVQGWSEFEHIDQRWIVLPGAGVFRSKRPPQLSRRNQPKPPLPLKCSRLIERLAHLDNWEDIKTVGEDAHFPRNISSIAVGNETCGDLAHGFQNSCEKYNSWRNFPTMLSQQLLF